MCSLSQVSAQPLISTAVVGEIRLSAHVACSLLACLGLIVWCSMDDNTCLMSPYCSCVNSEVAICVCWCRKKYWRIWEVFKHCSFMKWIHYILQKLKLSDDSLVDAHWKHVYNLNSEWTHKTGRHLLAGALCCDWTTERLATRPPGFSAFLKPCGIFLHSSSLSFQDVCKTSSVSLNGPVLCPSFYSFFLIFWYLKANIGEENDVSQVPYSGCSACFEVL